MAEFHDSYGLGHDAEFGFIERRSLADAFPALGAAEFLERFGGIKGRLACCGAAQQEPAVFEQEGFYLLVHPTQAVSLSFGEWMVD